jgi:hypothetical protein
MAQFTQNYFELNTPRRERRPDLFGKQAETWTWGFGSAASADRRSAASTNGRRQKRGFRQWQKCGFRQHKTAQPGLRRGLYMGFWKSQKVFKKVSFFSASCTALSKSCLERCF